MTINDLIDNFAVHLKQYGLDGDSTQQELYKWKIISDYHNKLDTDSPDFAENISKLNFQNLWFAQNQRGAMLAFVQYQPEEYRGLLKLLFDETQSLQVRIARFKDGSEKLWDSKIKQIFPHARPSCDERYISCLLATKYPEKYTFYKSDVYENLCELFGVMPKDAGEKLVHFYELMDEKVIPLVKSNAEICELIDKEVSQHNYISSLPLTAQTVIWNAMQQGVFHKKKLWLFYPGDDKQIFDDMVKDNYISVYQWGEIGSLESIKYKKDIKEALKEKVKEYKTKEPSYSVQMLYDMKYNMEVGDYVICRNKDFNQIVAFGEITGGYFFNPDHPVNNHCVEVKWYDRQWDITELLKDSKDPKSTIPRLQNVSKRDWGQKIMDILEGTNSTKTTPTPNNLKLMEELEILKQKKQIILQGAPGTGKTYKTASIAVGMCNPSFSDFKDHQKVMEEYERLQEKGQIAFCTFHQSMDYEDFVEGLKPEVNGDAVEYVVENGIFKTICEKAQNDGDKPYVLIIDEINRGNVSKIFGELITLLEADKRSGGGTHHISLKLPYSKEDFSVPSNLYIIGTMNTTDRSTGTIDYAVRRRFAFVTLESKSEVIEEWCNDHHVPSDVKKAALDLFDQINGTGKNDKNSFIAKHKASDFELEDLKVGHSYFMAEDMNSLKLKMRYEVVPLIKEYIKDGILRSMQDDDKYFDRWQNAERYNTSTTVVMTE